jgi:S1-C subfamily serine protease
MVGQVVGINTAIYGDRYQGISFALPSSTAKDVYERLKKGEKAAQTYGYLGVRLDRLSPTDAQRLKLKDTKGALITFVLNGSPADQAGFKPYDVVVSWDGRQVDDPNYLRLAVARTKPGAAVKVGIIREGQETSLEVTVGQPPSARQ